MPVLTAHDALGQLLQPGDRVAAPLQDDVWIGGAVMGFSPYNAIEPEALILTSRESHDDARGAAACRRLGSRQEVSW